jgi:uncharacterized protein YaaN involved in tellurite resistance
MSTLTKKEQALIVQPEIQEEASNVMQVIEKSSGGPSLERELNMIGEDTIKRAMSSQSMMQSSVNKALPELGKSSPMAKIINEATLITAEVNPSKVTQSFLFKILPFAPVRRALLRGYVENFQSNQSKVQGVFDNLESAKEKLLEKMIELEEQYNSLRETYGSTERDVVVCKAVQEKLDGVDVSSLDDLDKRKYDMSQNKVARRLRDLETIKAAIGQFFISIDQTFEVQVQLNQGIDSIRQVGPIVLQNAIMINAAISQQKEVADAVKGVSDQLGQAMRENARMVKGNAQTVADIYNNPVIALEDLQASYDDLNEAIEITRKARDESTEKARSMTVQLEKMNDVFKPVAKDIEGKRDDLQLTRSDSEKE